MVVTEDTKFTNVYKKYDDYNIQLTITSYKKGKTYQRYVYIIPYEFYEQVKTIEWEVSYPHHTPYMSKEQCKMIIQLTGVNRFKTTTLNMITPFIVVFKNGKSMVSSKNEYDSDENDKRSLWFIRNETEEEIMQVFDKYVERALQEK